MSFSIRQLLILTLFVAVGLVALANAWRPFVADAMQMLLFAVLAVVAYGIWFTTGERRAFRIGFLCWVIAMGTYGMTGAGNPYGFVQATLDRMAPAFQPKQEALTQVKSATTFSSAYVPYATAPTITLVLNNWQNYYNRVGYCLFPIPWGLLGGYVTVFCYRKKYGVAPSSPEAQM